MSGVISPSHSQHLNINEGTDAQQQNPLEEQLQNVRVDEENKHRSVLPESSESGSSEEHHGLHDEIKLGAEYVVKLFAPVSLCMLFVVATISNVTFYTTKDIYLLYTPFHETSPDTFTKVWNAAANSLIVLALVVTMTLILILLYKLRCYGIIHVWLIFSSLMLMFLFSLLFFEEVLRTYNVPMDLPTVLLFNWNFGVAGIMCIHWKGPLRMRQGYLIFIAALMALVFIKYLPEWTTWAMLFVISIWDIVAVLAPRGPLKILVEIAQERNETIFPSLIYSAMVYMMNTDHSTDENAPTLMGEYSVAHDVVPDGISNNSTMPVVVVHSGLPNSPLPPATNPEISTSSDANAENVLVCPSCRRPGRHPHHENQCDRCEQTLGPRGQQESDDDKGVKLGLGDFIFYSVLVGKASTYGDWNTTIACFVAILVGLCFTLLLLVVFKRALPALPISISIGLLFYFATNILVKPFFDLLASNQFFI